MARAGWHTICGAILLLVVLSVAPAGAGFVLAVDEGMSPGALSTETTMDTRSPSEEPARDGRSAVVDSTPEIDADAIILEAAVEEDGSATWRVTYQVQLSDDADIEAFQELQAAIENDTESYLGPFEERMNRTVASAESATGREMVATDFSVRTERDSQPQSEFGLVTFEFEWRGFAETTGSRIEAGEAIDSLFLDDGERLKIHWPSGYAVESSSPEPQTVRSGRVVWRGPIDFGDGEPRLTLTSEGTDEPTESSPDSSPASNSGDETPTEQTETDSGFPVLPLFAVLGLAVVAVGVLLFRRQEQGAPAGEEPADGDGKQSPPDELLSNEERVLRLLQQNGKRMKQKRVAEQLDWTAAKTSQVVGDLRDEGEIEAFRLGRENVLTLPGVDLETDDEDQQDSSGGESA